MQGKNKATVETSQKLAHKNELPTNFPYGME